MSELNRGPQTISERLRDAASRSIYLGDDVPKLLMEAAGTLDQLSHELDPAQGEEVRLWHRVRDVEEIAHRLHDENTQLRERNDEWERLFREMEALAKTNYTDNAHPIQVENSRLLKEVENLRVVEQELRAEIELLREQKKDLRGRGR